MQVNHFFSRLSKNKDTIVFIIIGILFVYANKQINPEFTFTGDGLNKIIQAEGLLKSNFTSEDLYYPASDIDPNYKFFPFPGYELNIPGRNLGQYPIAFSVITAIFLKFISAKYLTWICVFLALLLFLVLKKYFNLQNKFIIAGAFTTFIFLLSTEFSENIYTIFLTFTGFSIFITELIKESANKFKIFFAGCLIGIGIWLRLEGLIFSISLTFAYIITFREKFKKTYLNMIIFLSGIGIPAIMLLVFNYTDYGHILGPRYLIMTNRYFQSPLARLKQAMTLLFYNQFKVGYFVFTPYFLIILSLFSIKKYYLQLELENKFIYFTLVTYIPLIAFLAPNDGVVTWGPRYLAHAVLPNLLLIQPYLERLRTFKPLQKRIFDIMNGLSILVSIILLLLGIRFYSVASRQIKSFDHAFANEKSQIIIFQGELLAAHVGLNYFNKRIVLVKNTTELNELIQIIKNSNSINSIAFFKNDDLANLANSSFLQKCQNDKQCLHNEGYFSENESNEFDSILDKNFKETQKERTKLYTVSRYTK